MIQTTIQHLIHVLDADCSMDFPVDAQLFGVTIDSRAVAPGQAFVAVKGERFDGHDFAGQAAQQGAACVIVERNVNLPSDNSVPVLIVNDTLGALATLAAWYRNQLAAVVIAITGSAGKTTTRNMLCHVLSRRYRCHQAVNSFNNHIGVPLTILSAPQNTEVLLLELGTNHPGEIEPLVRIASPDIACVTLIGPAHLEGFGSLDNILIEKLSIAKGLKPDGTLYVNGDQDDLVKRAKTLGYRVKTFGTSPQCDVIGANIHSDGQAGRITLDGATITVPLPGKANLMNALTVWSICRDFKVSLSDFVEDIATLKPIAMRLDIQVIGQIVLINDCYNANPVSMANALETLAQLSRQENRRAVFIVGSMGEMGNLSADLHRDLGRRAVASGVRCLLACGSFASAIVAGAEEAGFDGEHEAFATTAKLCDKLHRFVRPADIVLVKGSRAAGLEATVEKIKKLFGPGPS